MTEEELIGKLEMIQRMKSESNILELKSAEKGRPLKRAIQRDFQHEPRR